MTPTATIATITRTNAHRGIVAPDFGLTAASMTTAVAMSAFMCLRLEGGRCLASRSVTGVLEVVVLAVLRAVIASVRRSHATRYPWRETAFLERPRTDATSGPIRSRHGRLR